MLLWLVTSSCQSYNKIYCSGPKFTNNLKLFWLSNYQYSKRSRFSLKWANRCQQQPVAACVVFMLASPKVRMASTGKRSNLPKLCWSAAPGALPLNQQSKPSIVFWNSFGSDCHMTDRGSNWVWKVLSALKSLSNLCGVWILLGLLKTPKLRTAVSQFQPSSPDCIGIEIYCFLQSSLGQDYAWGSYWPCQMNSSNSQAMAAKKNSCFEIWNENDYIQKKAWERNS